MTRDHVTDIKVSGNYAYVANRDNGSTIVDISNPSSSIITGSYDTAGHAIGISVSGNYAYVIEGYDLNVSFSGNYANVVDTDNGLLIVDISDPSSPVLKGSYRTAQEIKSVSVSGNYAYVAADNNFNNGLLIVDISNPSSPILKGACNGIRYACCVSVSGNYAYVTTDSDSLFIVDISDPSSPVLKGSCDQRTVLGYFNFWQLRLYNLL